MPAASGASVGCRRRPHRAAEHAGHANRDRGRGGGNGPYDGPHCLHRVRRAVQVALRVADQGLAPQDQEISGQRTGASLVNLQKPWRALRLLAGLDDVRIHDLRHTYASVGAGMGMSLPLLGRLLGHTQAATTSRYAHLSLDPVRIAASAIDLEIMRLAAADG